MTKVNCAIISTDRSMPNTIRIVALTALLLFMGICANASPAYVWMSSNYWTPLAQLNNQSPVFDAPNDQQTGDSAADFVGDWSSTNPNGNPGFYFAFDNLNDADPTNGWLMFRARFGEYKTCTGNGCTTGYSSTFLVGIDGNNDGKIDIFVGVDDRGNGGNAHKIKVWQPNCGSGNLPAGRSCFDGPSTTSLGTEITNTNPAYPQAEVIGTNYYYTAVSAAQDPRGVTNPLNTDLNADGKTDAFLSFRVDFGFIRQQLQNMTGMTNITDSSQLRFVTVTSQQNNSFNQDVGGCSDIQNGIWTSCGMTAYYTPLSGVPTPEPGTYAVAAVALLGFAVLRRRA